MALTITPEERENERLLFDEERKRVPELFVRAPMVDDDAALRSIGIEEIPAHRPVGFLKLMPQDFVVEEISLDGARHTVDLGDGPEVSPETDGQTYYADLVKVNISTIDAKARLIHLLDVANEKDLAYAGIKDRIALTSQAISFRGIKDRAKLENASDENFFLKNIRRGKGVLVNGDLQGNRFTITIRTPQRIDDALQGEMQSKIAEIKEDGFWNFFYFQRFGTPRLLSHVLGRLIVQGRYDDVIKMCCIQKGPYEAPYINAIREAIKERWGDWNAILPLIDCFPAYFEDERTFIHHLAKYPGDSRGALRALPDQIRLWMYAYASFLFNRKLSELIKEGTVPMNLPFIISHEPNDWKPYQKFLDEDGVRLPSPAFRDFHPMVYIASRRSPTLQKITIHDAVFQDQLAVFSFTLPKGSYATTFLMNFFTLTSEPPLPPGTPTGSIDARALLGQGTLAPVLERFETVLTRYQSDVAAGGEV